MTADFEFEPKELAKRGAKFCHNPREAVSEWDVIKTRFADALCCLRVGSYCVIEMSVSRVRLKRFMESFRQSLKKRPEIFDAESLRVLSKLESLTLEWVRRESKTKGDRFVDTPCERWMGAWQDFCNAYESFSETVEFELKYDELAFAGGRKRKPASTPAKPTANTKPLSKADDTHHAKVLKIVAAWRQHHDKPGGYCTDPATVADVVRASGIARRTLQRVVKAMFGISKGEDTAGWAHYQLMCQDQNVFLKWLDTIVKPAATLALLAPSPKAEGEQCDSCGERATNLKEYSDQELCPDCYSAAMGEN